MICSIDGSGNLDHTVRENFDDKDDFVDYEPVVPRKSSFKSIKEWIESDENLSARNDDSFIMQYLTISDFDLGRTKRRITRYNELRREISNWFEPYDDYIARDMICDQMVFYTTKFANNSDMAICVVKLGKIDFYKYSVDQYNNVGIAAAETSLVDLRYQILGVEVIIDFADLSWSSALFITHNYILKCINLWETAMPVKVKKVHLINANILVNQLINVGFYVLNKALVGRVINHGSDLKSLHEAIPSRYLPFEYDGNAGPAEYFANEVMENLLKKKSLPTTKG